MARWCSAYNCNNKQGRKNKHGKPVTFHRFPIANPELLKQWLVALKREDFTPTKYSLVCSDHFCASRIRVRAVNGFEYLLPSTVPCIQNADENENKVCKIHPPPRKPPVPKIPPALRLNNTFTKDIRKKPAIKKKKKKRLPVKRAKGLKKGYVYVEEPAQPKQAVVTELDELNILEPQVDFSFNMYEGVDGPRKSSRLQDEAKRDRARQINLADRWANVMGDSEDETETSTSHGNPKSNLMTSLGLHKLLLGDNATFKILDMAEMHSGRMRPNAEYVESPNMSDVSTQWEDMGLTLSADHSYSSSNSRNTKKVATITSSSFQCNLLCFTSKLMNDSDLYFYAGLSKGTFGRLVKLLQPEGDVQTFQMTIDNQILLVLVYLRLGLQFSDLGRRFNVSMSTVTRVFLYWLPIMVEELGKLIIWLPKETIHETLPECFQNTYPETTCILSWTEVLIQKPEGFWDHDEADNNECENSFKCLLAVAPDGTIMFVSDCYSSRLPNDYIIENCGILNYLSIGDEVVTSPRLLVRDLLPQGVKHTVPSFDDDESDFLKQDICNVKIHAQKVTSKLRNFRILNSCAPLPEGTMLDEIVIVCAALCNLQPCAIE